MPASSWIAHVKSVYAKGKSKGMSYKDALRAAAKTWKKSGGKSKPKASKASKSKAEEAPEESEEAPKKRRRKRARPGVGPDEKNIN